jgi:hypothetical protein
MKTVTAKSYTLKTESGNWLGQVMLSSDGAFTSITDYGNFSHAWRSYGHNFRDFIISLEVDYFATKMFTGNSYINSGKRVQQAAQLFAEKILPALQKVLKEELEDENHRIAVSSNELFTRKEIETLRHEAHELVGDGPVMQLFNKLLGVNAA